MDVLPVRQPPISGLGPGVQTPSPAWRIVALAVAVMCFVAAVVMVLDARAGLDLTDEGLYLLAADNHQPTAALNGWFGAYTGLLFSAMGHDIALFRVAAMALLLACGALLGTAVLSVVAAEGIVPTRASRISIVLGIAAGQLLFYGIYLRSPGYNWLALTGALLAATGMLRQIAAPQGRARTNILVSGLLIGVGCFLAFQGKASLGIGLAVLELLVVAIPAGANQRSRISVALDASAATVALIALHSIFIADPATTIAVMQRSLAFLAFADADRYGPVGAVRAAALDVARAPWPLVLSTYGALVLSVAPIVLMARRGRSAPRMTAVFAIAAIAGVALALLLHGRWVGGTDASGRLGLAHVAVLTSAALAAVTSWLVSRSKWDEEAPPRWRLMSAAGVLAGAAVLYAFGSGNGLITQMSGAGGLVLTSAALLGVVCVPRRWASSVLVGFSVAMASVALLGIGTARLNPYRTEPLDMASVTIAFGQRGIPLNVDPDAAAFWRTLQTTVSAEGWQPGTKLLDLTFSPAVGYALGATVPQTLVSQQTATAIEALRLSGGPLWRDAWILVPQDLSADFIDLRPAEILATVGRRFPSDYKLVAKLTAPWRNLPIELWKPVIP